MYHRLIPEIHDDLTALGVRKRWKIGIPFKSVTDGEIDNWGPAKEAPRAILKIKYAGQCPA